MRRLLVVEDHEDLLDVLSSLLASAGYTVVSASTPDRAVAALENGGFDLVLADLMLEPRRLDACWRTIDQLVELARPAPLGLLTAWPVSADEAERHRLAFALAKPCSRAELLAQLAHTLHLPPLDAPRAASLRSYFGCIERAAYDELGRLCTEDVVYRLPGADPRFANEVRGRDAFLAFTAQTFGHYQQPRFELGSMRTLPAGAMVEYMGSWGDGDSRRQMPGAVMFELRDSLIQGIHVRVASDELR